MRLELTDEQELLRQSFAQLFAAESSPARVRAAEPVGFDPALWKQLAQTGALAIRVPEAAGGSGGSLLDAALVVQEAGRRLASGPIAEGIVVARALSACPGAAAGDWLKRLRDGEVVVSLALRDFEEAPAQWLAAGAVADAVVAIEGSELVLLCEPERRPAHPVANLGSSPLGRWRVPSRADPERRHVLERGEPARRLFESAREEWKLLTASALAGLAREALEIAGRYAAERVQFGRPIGAFQGVSHPLAESVADVEGARLLVWKAIWAIANGRSEAAALVSMSYAWAALAATRAVGRALHAHGGYGLSLEYDIQLYHRRGKAWPLILGDPQDELAVVADRLWGEAGARVALPEAGEVALDFGRGQGAERFAAEARRFFEANLTDELRRHAHFAWEGHHPGFQRRLAEAGLLYPAWPREYGGQARGPDEIAALAEVFHEFGWTRFAISTTDMIARTVMRFATPELKDEVLPRIARGEAICSMGYTEPGAGSDVAAVQTRARPAGEGGDGRTGWVIDGQKMFTSGANLAQYVFLLTRTNPDAPKHRGLTMFLVPLDTPGIEIQPVHTLSDERTNLTFYNAVRVPDRYRVGPVDGGWAVVAYALELEHAAAHVSNYRRMLAGAVEWARERPEGRATPGVPLERPVVRDRLARVAVHVEVAAALDASARFEGTRERPDPARGPMAKFFSTDHFIADAADLMDLCAPDSLLQRPEGGRAAGAAAVEFGYRLSTATSIYGGTSEIMKSIVAQASLGLPRSRS